MIPNLETTMCHEDLERAHDNQVYQACGLALRWAQLFEGEIVNAMLFHSIAQNKFLARSEAEAFLTKTERRQLRKLIEKGAEISCQRGIE